MGASMVRALEHVVLMGRFNPARLVRESHAHAARADERNDVLDVDCRPPSAPSRRRVAGGRAQSVVRGLPIAQRSSNIVFVHIPTDLIGSWQGSNGFRLMPDDELADLPSEAEVTPEAAGHAVLVRYEWTHPDDGLQHGTLLLGTPFDGDKVTAGWVDSWHQKPELRLLTGTVTDTTIELAMEYDGWGWTITLSRAGESLTMVMQNVIPDGVEGARPGPYVVMDARWD